MSVRINKLRSSFSVEAALILDEHNRRYLSGFPATDGALLITEKDAVLFADSRYYESAKKQASCDVMLTKNLTEQIKELLGGWGINELTLEYSVKYSDYDKLVQRLAPVAVRPDRRLDEELAALRAVKDEQELSCIRSAQGITDAAFEYILGYVKAGVSEKALAARLIGFMLDNGADGEAFETIVLAGRNTSVPHGVASDYEIKSGDFVLFDFGAKYGGYCSDMTRTVAVGAPSEKQLDVYDTVLRAQSAALAAARAGMTGRELDRVARDVIDSSPYKGAFGHGLGHSLGLEIHELPAASPSYEKKLPVGAMMTVEPGIYLEGEFGVRTEDMVRLSENGAENLTKSPRNPLF